MPEFSAQKHLYGKLMPDQIQNSDGTYSNKSGNLTIRPDFVDRADVRIR